MGNRNKSKEANHKQTQQKTKTNQHKQTQNANAVLLSDEVKWFHRVGYKRNEGNGNGNVAIADRWAAAELQAVEQIELQTARIRIARLRF